MLIQEGFAKAEGDRARTSTEVAARFREIGGRVKSLAESLGAALAPAAKAVLGDMAVGLTALQIAWKENQTAITAYFTNLFGGAKSGDESIGILQMGIASLADAWQSVSIAFSKVQVSVTGGIIDMIKSFDKLGGTIGSIIQYLSPAAGAFSSIFNKEALAGLEALQAEQKKTLAGKKEAEPFSKGINAAFAKARTETKKIQDELLIGGMTSAALGGGLTGGGLAQIAAKQAASAPIAKMFSDQDKLGIANLMAGGLGSIAGGIKPRKSTGEFKFATAAAAGSAEAANTILRSKYGEGKATPEMAAKATAKNTATANTHLARIASGMDKLILYGNLQPYEVVGDLS